MNQDEEFLSTQPINDDDTNKINYFFKEDNQDNKININYNDNDDEDEQLIATPPLEPLLSIPFNLISQRNSDLFSNHEKKRIIGLNSVSSKFDELNSISPEKLRECEIDIPLTTTNNNNNNNNNKQHNYNRNQLNNNISPTKLLDLKIPELDLFLSNNITNITSSSSSSSTTTSSSSNFRVPPIKNNKTNTFISRGYSNLDANNNSMDLFEYQYSQNDYLAMVEEEEQQQLKQQQQQEEQKQMDS